MYEFLPKELRTMESGVRRMEPYKRGLIHRAAGAIEKLNSELERLSESRWRPAEEKPPVEKERRDKDGNLIQVSIPVLACCRDGSRRIVRWLDDKDDEPGGYAWHGWVREPDDGCIEDVAWWMELPKGPKEEA